MQMAGMNFQTRSRANGFLNLGFAD
ncbi:hypothetical protein [Robinsoniella sp. KNHs210]